MAIPKKQTFDASKIDSASAIETANNSTFINNVAAKQEPSIASGEKKTTGKRIKKDKIISIAISQNLYDQVSAIAISEEKTVSELFRDAMRIYLKSQK